MYRHQGYHNTIVAILATFFLFWANTLWAGDWMPITGSGDPQSGSSSGTSSGSQPFGGFRPGHWDLPRSDPGPVHPPPAPRQNTTASCGIAAAPARVEAGDYVTVVVTVAANETQQIGRLDLIGPDGAVSGIVRNGSRFDYTWPVPRNAQGGQNFRFTIYRANTGFANEPQILCAGSAVVDVVAPSTLQIALRGWNKVPVNANWLMSTTVEGGQGPYAYSWTIDGRVVFTERTAATSTLKYKFAQKGDYAVGVRVESSNGASASDSAKVSVYACSLSVSGPTHVHQNELGTWNVQFKDGYGPYQIEWVFRTWLRSSLNSRDGNAVIKARMTKVGNLVLQVSGRDKTGCRTTGEIAVNVEQPRSGTPGGS